jgi:hypothetical protein
MDDTNYFSDEYQPVHGTSEERPDSSCKDSEPQVIESEKYGISKPQRIIIKARLIDGKD